MALTTNPEEARKSPIKPDGQQEIYVVLSEEERAAGFVRPVRRSYRHIGVRPRHPLRDLTPEEHARHDSYGYVKYEPYQEEGEETSENDVLGKFWTQRALDGGCGSVTTMGIEFAETYARDPSFYGGTFCATCRSHFPVGVNGEFVWLDDESKVGT
ncbi:MAG: hypothetical protein NUW01_04745 [Gemmatimonadaceae bacterium]|nr:hypothetical protein [Gemmatimonadaceae bacterium]